MEVYRDTCSHVAYSPSPVHVGCSGYSSCGSVGRAECGGGGAGRGAIPAQSGAALHSAFSQQRRAGDHSQGEPHDIAVSVHIKGYSCHSQGSLSLWKSDCLGCVVLLCYLCELDLFSVHTSI